MGRDENYIEWRNREFESVIENIYDIKRFNGMNHVHNNEVNNMF